ncbi:MAG: DJ-1/PfpI family protein [Candidatus Micrarchaeia archaeon]
MKLVMVIPPGEFKDETVVKVSETMQKWKVDLLIASSTKNECKGSHGAMIKPKLLISDINSNDFDGIIISNGLGIEDYKLYESRQLIDLIKHFNENRKIICGIGNGLKIISRANIISNKKICSLKDPETLRFVKLFRGIVTENDVQIDQNLITATSSDKVSEFSKAIIEVLELL